MNNHAMHLSYDLRGPTFMALVWAFARGGEKVLLLLGEETGRVLATFAVPKASEHAFCLHRI